MPFTISEVAKQIGIRPSAIRYYEQIGILPAPRRVSGQRRYDDTTLHRLVMIHRARQTGFTLTEIKQLFFGFLAGTPPSVRWQRLKKRKIVELDEKLSHLQTMRDLLERQGKCRCTALEECGKKIFEKQCVDIRGAVGGKDDSDQRSTRSSLVGSSGTSRARRALPTSSLSS